MSSQQQFQSSSGAPPPAGKPQNPVCPQCNSGMTVKQVTPVLFASDVDDVIYGCPKCGTETRRAVRRA